MNVYKIYLEKEEKKLRNELEDIEWEINDILFSDNLWYENDRFTFLDKKRYYYLSRLDYITSELCHILIERTETKNGRNS